MWKLRFLAMIASEGMFLGPFGVPIFGPKLSNRLLRNSFRMVLQNEADWKWQSEGISLEAATPFRWVRWIWMMFLTLPMRRFFFSGNAWFPTVSLFIYWWRYGRPFSMESNTFDLVAVHVLFPANGTVLVPVKTWFRHIGFWLAAYLFTNGCKVQQIQRLLHPMVA